MRILSVHAILLLMLYGIVHSQEPRRVFTISHDLEVKQISPRCFVHVSWSELPRWGRFPSNGIIFKEGNEALLFDTPMSDSLTRILVRWINDTLNAQIIGFVPNHWHGDCVGGLTYLQSLGVPSYAGEKTIEMTRSHHLPVPAHAFRDSLVLHVGPDSVVCRYFGAGHAVDNIVAWFPSEQVLFGGCMVRETATSSLGNTADADLAHWPVTIGKVLSAYPTAKTVVPGHGAWGGVELLRHTIQLLKQERAD